jgi:hypothetical protein
MNGSNAAQNARKSMLLKDMAAAQKQLEEQLRQNAVLQEQVRTPSPSFTGANSFISFFR